MTKEGVERQCSRHTGWLITRDTEMTAMSKQPANHGVWAFGIAEGGRVVWYGGTVGWVGVQVPLSRWLGGMREFCLRTN